MKSISSFWKAGIGLAVSVLMVGLVMTPSDSSAATIVLDFEGLQNVEPIAEFYNGGLGGLGSGPGPDYDISFGGDALALIDADAGGSGNIANEPSPDTVAFFLSGPGVVMNVDGGFTTGFSFFYTSATAGAVTVHSGPDGTGDLLASVPITAQHDSCGEGDPTGGFSCWTAVGVTFDGVAASVNFGGVANQTAFDDITLGSDTPGGGGTKADILIDSGVPGKGLENAPGLEKEFNPKSKAAENAGKK